MPANIHARHPHPHMHARQQSISDPLPIPTLSGLEATGAVETAAATGTALVLPSNVPASNGGGDTNQGIPLVPGQSAVTVTSTTPASVTPAASATDANASSSSSSSSSNANASSGNSNDLSIPTVVGICVGVFAGLALIILCVVWWSKKHGAKNRRRGAGGRKGGRFKPIPDDRSFVSGEDEMAKGAGADAGVKGMEKIRGSRVRFEKPPPYESYIAPRSSTSKGPELTVPTNTQLPPISPSSPISISPIHFRSTSPTPLQAAHVPQPQNRHVSYGETLTVQTHSYHPYASPLLSARTPSPNSAYSPTPPHSANVIAGAGFGAAQAQYYESRALLEGRNRVPNETPTPTSSSQTHATFVTAASIGVPGSGYSDEEDVLPTGTLGARLAIPKQSYNPDQVSPISVSAALMHTAASQLSTTSARLDQRALGSKPSHTKLEFNSSLGMSQTFHDRSSLYAASALDPDTSTSTSSEDHSFLSMRNSDLSLQLRMNMKTSPEAKSPALQFDFTQVDAHRLEREGEVVTPPAIEFGAGGIGNRRETFGMGTGANIGSGKPWIQMNRMDSSSPTATAATAESTTFYSTSPSTPQTRPSLFPKHTRSSTSTSTSTSSSSNTIRNPFSDVHANAHTLPKLNTVPISRAESGENAYTPGHKKMASLLAALNIPVTPSSESGDEVDTVVDAH